MMLGKRIKFASYWRRSIKPIVIIPTVTIWIFQDYTAIVFCWLAWGFEIEVKK